MRSIVSKNVHTFEFSGEMDNLRISHLKNVIIQLIDQYRCPVVEFDNISRQGFLLIVFRFNLEMSLRLRDLMHFLGYDTSDKLYFFRWKMQIL